MFNRRSFFKALPVFTATAVLLKVKTGVVSVKERPLSLPDVYLPWTVEDDKGRVFCRGEQGVNWIPGDDLLNAIPTTPMSGPHQTLIAGQPTYTVVSVTVHPWQIVKAIKMPLGPHPYVNLGDTITIVWSEKGLVKLT